MSSSDIDWTAVRSILARDMAAVTRSKAVVLPMLLVPMLLLVLLPMAEPYVVGGHRTHG